MKDVVDEPGNNETTHMHRHLRVPSNFACKSSTRQEERQENLRKFVDTKKHSGIRNGDGGEHSECSRQDAFQVLKQKKKESATEGTEEAEKDVYKQA